jgi:hypothetical protein
MLPLLSYTSMWPQPEINFSVIFLKTCYCALVHPDICDHVNRSQRQTIPVHFHVFCLAKDLIQDILCEETLTEQSPHRSMSHRLFILVRTTHLLSQAKQTKDALVGAIRAFIVSVLSSAPVFPDLATGPAAYDRRSHRPRCAELAGRACHRGRSVTGHF